MTLLELCDPLFKYICFLNRSARKGMHIDAGQVDSDLEGILSDMKAKASANGLGDQYEKIEYPLIFFADNVIAGSSYPFADSYERLAYKPSRDRVTGDTDFCDELDLLLESSDGASASSRLAVFYTCLGLGFTGDRLGDSELRKQKMTAITRKIRAFTDAGDRGKLTPQAYEYTLLDDLIPPPVGPVWTVAVGMIMLMIVLVVVAGFVYKTKVTQLGKALNTIVEAHK